VGILGSVESLPPLARGALAPLANQLASLDAQICDLDRKLLAWHRSNETSQRLATIPGVGPVTASALAASITDPSMFASGREFSAFLGLVPRQNTSGRKVRLGRTSKKGDRYLRTLLVCGATSLLSHSRRRQGSLDIWAKTLLEKKKPTKLVALALANKMARIAWALMNSEEIFKMPAPGI
jgi:transposase